jgi:hypothetical protein
MQLGYTLFFTLLACSTTFTNAAARQDASSLKVQEELLGEKSPETSPDDKEDVVSRDGKRVAWRDKRGKNWVVMVNGEEVGTSYKDVEWIIFSRDNQHLAYKAKKDKNWLIVIDGKEEEIVFEEVGNPWLSPDGQHYAYRAGALGKWVVVVDGQSTMRIVGKNKIQGIAYDEVGNPRFSREGQHLAYRAKKMGGKWLIVLDGKEGKAYEDVGEPSFSSDGQHFIYPAKSGKKWTMVVDGEEYGPEMKEPWVGTLVGERGIVRRGLPWVGLTSEGQWIYFGRIEKRWAAIVGGQPGPEFDVLSWPFRFGPQDRRIAYAGAELKSGGRKAIGRVIIDHEAGPAYEGQPTESTGSALVGTFLGGGRRVLLPGVFLRFYARSHGVSSPVRSPDHMHIAYSARRGDEDYVVVLDGEAGESFNSIDCGPFFAPDGTLVYVGKKEEKVVLVANGEHLNEFPWDKANCTNLSLEGKHTVHVVSQGPIHRVFVDGKPGKVYDAKRVTNLKTRLSGKELRLAYEVRGFKEKERETSFVVLDGQEGKHYDEVMYNTLDFLDEKTVVYVARNDRKFLRVTQSLP